MRISPSRSKDLTRNVSSSSPLSNSTRIGNGQRSSSSSESVKSVSSQKSESSGIGSIKDTKDTNVIKKNRTTLAQSEDNIHVVVRVRPLNSRELRCGDVSTVFFPGNGQILVHGMPNGNSNQKEKTFSFDAVFEPAANQEDVFQFSGITRLIEMAIEGFRCTVFCYGQTGSGKTHTLTGPPGLFVQKPSPYNKDHGLVLRSFVYLFNILGQNTAVNYTLKTSFLEIYNEKIIDLLNPGSSRKPLPIRWSKKANGFFVENLFTVVCEEFDDLLAVLEEGMRNRHVGKHNMNEYSSRSHTILTINIASEQPSEGGVYISRTGKLNFVDLAGSEITKKTQSCGKTLEEANNINKSLMVLGYCISSLSDVKRKGNHIPYRDSNLTKLLADSLAGNGVTLMVACISPTKSNQSESTNTLRYASRAKKIKTKPTVLMDPREALILNLKREITSLQSENEHLKSAFNIHQTTASTDHITGTDLEKIAELEAPELAHLVRLYANENKILKKENSDLFLSKELLLRDHELVCRENERLLKKLEDVNSVCCRSPLIPARATLSASDLDDITQQSHNINHSSPSVPKNVTKELDIRQIGKVNFSSTRSRRSSWNEKAHPLKARNLKSSETTTKDDLTRIGSRRVSIATDGQNLMDQNTKDRFQDKVINGKENANKNSNLTPRKNHDPFGSRVSLVEDPG